MWSMSVFLFEFQKASHLSCLAEDNENGIKGHKNVEFGNQSLGESFIFVAVLGSLMRIFSHPSKRISGIKISSLRGTSTKLFTV